MKNKKQIKTLKEKNPTPLDWMITEVNMNRQGLR